MGVGISGEERGEKGVLGIGRVGKSGQDFGSKKEL